LARKLKAELLPGEIRVPPIKLDTVGHVLTEMQRLYRQARCQKLSTDDMGRMVFALEKIRATLEIAAPVIENGGGTTVVNVIGIPSGAQIDPETGQIIHADGTRAAPIPFFGFVPTADHPELEPTARILQLEERCEALEKRNVFLEWLHDPQRPQPVLLGAVPRLIVDNVDNVDDDESADADPPAA
jgi:hypothetical protein